MILSKLKKTIISIILLIFLINNSLIYSQYSEYEIKAAMIGKFTLFIDWPEEVINNSKYFIINIIGVKEILKPFKTIYKNKKIKNLPVKIIYSNDINNEIINSHIIFVNKKFKNKIKSILTNLFNKSTLLISDDDSLAKLGAHISFYLKDENVRFKINYRTLKRTHLNVSYLLLNYGKVIER